MAAAESLDLVFAALADPTRRAMLERLAAGSCSVTELGEPFDVSAPAISKHLRVLENAGLIVRVKEGRVTYCRLTEAPFGAATRWLDKQRTFWEQQFDALHAFVEQEHPRWAASTPRPRASSSASSASSPRRASGSSRRGLRRRR